MFKRRGGREFHKYGGVAKWLGRYVSNLVACYPIDCGAGTTNHKPSVSLAVHPSEVGKWVLRGNSEGASSGATGPHRLHSCHIYSKH